MTMCRTVERSSSAVFMNVVRCQVAFVLSASCERTVRTLCLSVRPHDLSPKPLMPIGGICKMNFILIRIGLL
jgi:hypothetical protein